MDAILILLMPYNDRFHERKEKDYPETWVKYIKNSVAQIAPRFTGCQRKRNDLMDAILILLMPYNDRFQSDRVVQPFLVNDDRHLVFLTSLHRGVQSFSRIL